MLAKKFTIKIISSHLKSFLFFSILFSFDSYSAVYPGSKVEPQKIEYECGKKCLAINQILFELAGDENFITEEKFWSAKMESFDRKISDERMKINSNQKVKVDSIFTLSGRFLPNYSSVDNMLKVYVNMTQYKCDYSTINFEIVSLSVNGFGYEKLICKKSDNKCIDDVLSRALENHVLDNVRDVVMRPTIKR
ncbi:MAG: hypothetical protein EOO52_10145 [Gammaproteobacteria bacterium]|nr:MAG: hypothetical protein EOO52_10145 [Gammaproteobacteria bacterium]